MATKHLIQFPTKNARKRAQSALRNQSEVESSGLTDLQLVVNPKHMKSLNRARIPFVNLGADIYLDSVSPNGLFQCNVEGNGQTVWMYLLDLNQKSRMIVADAPICSLVALITVAQFEECYHGHAAPPLTEEYCSKRAVISDLTGSMIGIRWARDAVVAMVKREPFAMIIEREKKGYSRALRKDGP